MSDLQIKLLQGMPIFGAIREDVLRYLLEQTRMVEVAAGDFFYHEGEQGHSLYVLESGTVTIIKHWREHELELGRFGPGDCFGEMSLLDPNPRSASVRAVDACVAIEIGNVELYGLFKYDLEQFALIQMNISRELCRRLRITGDMLFKARMGEMAESMRVNL